MFNHIMVGVNDLEASKRFYDAVFEVMGVGPGVAGNVVGFTGISTGVFHAACGSKHGNKMKKPRKGLIH